MPAKNKKVEVSLPSLFPHRIYAMLLLPFLLLSFQRVSFGQKSKYIIGEGYRAVHWNLWDGLPDPKVWTIKNDINGFLWLGTGRQLSRFDGSTFKNYSFGLRHTNLGMVEDSLHNIWFGTQDKLYRYNMKADTFTGFASYAPVTASKTEVFCRNDTAFFAINIQNFAVRKVCDWTPQDSLNRNLSGLATFYDEASNSLWVLRMIMDHGWKSAGLLEISASTGEKKYYNWQCFKNIPGHVHAAEGMVHDRKRNCIWINNDEGLIKFTLEDKKFHFIKEVDFGRWIGICLDHEDRVWLATYEKGIVIYDPDDQSVRFPFSQNLVNQNEIADNNAILYCDKEGIIWSGYWLSRGLYQILPYEPSFTYFRIDSGSTIGNIQTIADDKDGKQWIGANDGINRVFDPKTETIQMLGEKELGPDLYGKGGIWPFIADTVTGRLYHLLPGGFGVGLWQFDQNSKKLQHITLKNKNTDEIHMCPR